jgi:hypothetical protein
MPLELLLERVQPFVELLRFGVQPDEFGHQRRQSFVAQRGCIIVRDQSTTASAGAIKLLCTLRTQARPILLVHSSTD